MWEELQKSADVTMGRGGAVREAAPGFRDSHHQQSFAPGPSPPIPGRASPLPPQEGELQVGVVLRAADALGGAVEGRVLDEGAGVAG